MLALIPPHWLFYLNTRLDRLRAELVEMGSTTMQRYPGPDAATWASTLQTLTAAIDTVQALLDDRLDASTPRPLPRRDHK